MDDARALDHGGPVAHPHVPFPETSLSATVADRFEVICAARGSSIAIVDRNVTLTYSQLRHRIDRIACQFDQVLGDDPRPVALLMAHTADVPIAMLAALSSGRGYVPLDPTFPEARNRQILEQSGVSLLLSDADCHAAALALAGTGLPVHRVDAWTNRPTGISRARRDARASDLAYVVFTSGTTGSPKGVFQDQAGLLHDVMQYSNAAHIAPTDRMTLLYSPSVNGAIRDIFGALLNGAALHVLDPRLLGPAGIADALRLRHITIYHSVPMVFRRVMATLAPTDVLPHLRLAYLAGDRVEPADVALFRAHTGPEAFFYTGIGASEVATLYAHMFLSASDPVPGPRLPVGHAIPDRTISLLDTAGAPVANGETGLIAVTSRYLARGYRGDPAASARAFQARGDGTRRYMTGDLGRWRPDGRLEHLGRVDHQVKIRGHRVELADVESALCLQAGVAEAAALVQESDGVPVLVAFWAPSANGTATATATLRAALLDTLAPWAVPGRFVRLQSLPRLANHKLDRRALAELAGSRDLQDEVPAADHTLLGQVLQTVRTVTGLTIAPDERFDAIGIDSLHAIQILSALERLCRRPLLPALTGPDSTPRRIVDHLLDGPSHGLPREPAPVVLKTGRDARERPLLIMADVEGDFRHIGRLVDVLPDLRTCLGFTDLDDNGIDTASGRMAAIATRIVAAILAAGVRPPYLLLGYSFGGRVAYAVGVRLRALGHAVDFVGLLDTTRRPPGFHPPRPDAAMAPETRRQATRLWSRAEASRLYRPEVSDLQITLFRSDTPWPGEDVSLGWNAVAPEIRLIQISGSHHSMLHPTHLATLAAAVGNALP